jgi:DNA-binding LacI/PurR family transcriptional regulator
MPTIRDVASKAGVHASTVSRVFSGNAKISAETRLRVLTAAKELNFQPNAVARSLSVSQTNILGIVIPHIYDGYFDDSFFPQIMRGLMRVAYQHNYRVLVGGSNSHEDELSQILNMLSSRQVDGVVALSSRLDVDTTQELYQVGAPFVLIGKPLIHQNEIAWIATDDRRYTRQAVDYLLNLGHRRIAYVGGDPGVIVTSERLAGYKDALVGRGIEPTDALSNYGYFAEEGGHRAVEIMFDLAEPPTAFYCANDLMAIGVMRGLRDRGLRIPQDVSVVGTNGSPESAWTVPALSTLRVPYAALAAGAAQMLITGIQRESGPVGSPMLDCELVIRQSSGPAPP